jgi:hypothetical protein
LYLLLQTINMTMKGFFCSLVCITAVLLTNESQAQFTKGNIVVLQVGNGAAALGSTATPVVLKEYNTTTLNQSSSVSTVYVDSAGAARLTVSGTAISEGQMTLSSDSSKLVIAGYDASLGTTVTSTASTIVARVIDTVSYSGIVGRADTTKTAFSTGSIGSAVRGYSNNYWASGSNNGIYYMGNLASPDTVYDASRDVRVIQAANGKLYFSTASGLSRIGRINSQPVTGMVTADTMITLGSGTTPSPYGFAVNRTESVVYVADDRASANGGGLQKWTLSGSTWTLAYTLSTGSTSGARSVIADWSGGFPVVYAVTAAATSALIKLTDSNSTAPAQSLATAPSNTAFRSVAFAPKPASCPPPAAFITAVTSTTICQGDFAGLHTNSAPGLTYSWKRGNSIFAGPSTTDSIIKANGPGQYRVIVSNGAGCTDSSAVVTVVVNPLPIATINPGFADTLCAGDTIRLKAFSAIGNTYQWKLNGTSLSASPDSNLSFITPLIATDSTYKFYVVVRSASGCVDSSSAERILVQGSPTPAIVNNSGVLSTGTFSSYQWYLNGAAMSGANGMTYTPTMNGDYSVFVTSAGGCSAMSATISVTGVGMHTTLLQRGVRIYPNPASDHISIEASFEVTIVLRDLQGRTVGSAENKKSISVESLAAGTYAASVYDSHGALIGTQLVTKASR